MSKPLRVGKHSDYEGGIRVPLLVCWPVKLKPGESQSPVIALAVGAKPFGGEKILPVLRGETPPPRNLFWSAGSEEGWWAVRSDDWKRVGAKARLGLFELSKDVLEKNDLAKTMLEKVAELPKLHAAWLAEMANPVKAGGKRYGMEPPAGFTPKKPKSERKKNQLVQPPKAPSAAK